MFERRREAIRRRLSAEQLRDSLLFVSGLMTDKAGGPPVWPELPTDILQANPALLDDKEPTAVIAGVDDLDRTLESIGNQRQLERERFAGALSRGSGCQR